MFMLFMLPRKLIQSMNTSIRLRACLAVIESNKILLVAHYNTDVSAIQWLIPGGGVEFCEEVRQAALREFNEETGLQAQIDELLEVTEVIKSEQPWHSVTITFKGRIIGGTANPEVYGQYGKRDLRWFSKEELADVHYHPIAAVHKALGKAS